MDKKNTNNKIVERYSPSIKTGLSALQVKERISSKLTNSVNNRVSKTYFGIIADNLFTFFNLLGLIVTIALLSVGAPKGDFFFAFIYLANIAIGIIQEIRAKRSIDKLCLVSNKTVKVIRDGQQIDISSHEIVLDDILILGIGNQVPTDCKILDGEIELNESLLTGESIPVKKKVGDEILAGSFITSGVCTVIAHKVGKENYVEKLQDKAKLFKKPRSELMKSLTILIKVIGSLIVPFVIALLFKQLILVNTRTIDTGVEEFIRATATSAIGMIPSGMFLLTSMALAVGIIKLAKHKTLVKDLYSLEMLARVDTVCFDKTGTITDGNMNVSEVICLKNTTNEQIKEIVSSMLFSFKDQNQTSEALKNYFGSEEKFTAISILPFNSSRKLSAVTFDNQKTYAFGAPEFILSKLEYEKIQSKIEEYASKGLRVLVLAYSPSVIENDIAPNDFSPISLILLSDNIRKDAIDTIKWFKENGVAIKVISGDNPLTVSEVSKLVGIENAEKFVSLEGLSDEKVAEIANEYTVFGRVSPEQKAILIKSMKNAKHVVAMTGDGVNDILALKESDCAITVANGSDAAKSVSHLVLMNNNFNSLPHVVLEGRRVINNVQSSASLFLMKTIFTMVINILTLFFYEAYPFVLSNMIFLESCIIGLPAFFLSLQPNETRVEGKFIKKVVQKSVPSAMLMILNVFIISFFGDIVTDQTYKTIAVIALTFAGLISLFNICRPLNKYRSILFFVIFGVIFLGSIIMIMNPFVSSLFGLTTLFPFYKYTSQLVLLILVLVLDLPITILLKKLFNFLNSKKKQKDN